MSLIEAISVWVRTDSSVILCMICYLLVVEHLFFFIVMDAPVIYTLSLHDALPICARFRCPFDRLPIATSRSGGSSKRSEEHTSELQSRVDLVCRLLLEKKNIYD